MTKHNKSAEKTKTSANQQKTDHQDIDRVLFSEGGGGLSKVISLLMWSMLIGLGKGA